MRSLQFVLSAAVLAAGALFLPAAQATVVAVPGVQTNLSSKADKMISFRHQKHSWVTADQQFQLLYNTGSTAGDALQLSTSPDGVTWTKKLTLANSDENSSADGSLNGGLLSVVYSTANKGINFAPLKYDPSTQSWKIKGPGQVVRDGKDKLKGKPAYVPSLVEDQSGNFWVVFLEQTVKSGQSSGPAVLRLYYRAKDASTWSDTGLAFHEAANRPYNEPKLSARLVRTLDSIGMVIADGADIWWAQRPADAAWNGNWQASQVLIQGTPDSEADVDPYASHFSTTTDDQGNIHLVYADAKKPYYRRFNALVSEGGPAWSLNSIAFSDTPLDTGYPEVSYLGGSSIAVVFNAHVEGKVSNLRVYQSASRGSSLQSFKCTHLLTHEPAPDGNQTQYQHMRNEMPAVAPAAGVPVLLQYQVPKNGAWNYKALNYSFPASTTPGCTAQ